MGLVDEEEGEGWLVLREDIFCMRWSSLADMVIWLAVRFSCVGHFSIIDLFIMLK